MIPVTGLLLALAGGLLLGGRMSPGQQPSPTQVLAALDFQSGKNISTLDLAVRGVAANPQDQRHSLVLAVRGNSQVVWTFRLPAVPPDGVLELVHLSASAPSQPLGGISPVRIRLNGGDVCRPLDPGSHGFVSDRLHVTKFLRAGRNTLELSLDDRATSAYWLRRAALLGSRPPVAAKSVQRHAPPGGGPSSYVVCVSTKTLEDPGWKAVVQALVKKHTAVLLVYRTGAVDAVVPDLVELQPRYVAFVARPGEAKRNFVLHVHQLTRRLDKDPYTDCLWGIVTGFEPADALRMVNSPGPFKVRRLLSGCGITPHGFQEGVAFSEGRAGQMWEKPRGGSVVEKSCPKDATAWIVRELNQKAPQAVITSGHATNRDWQIGYAFKSGQLRCHKGRLFGLDLAGHRYPIQSPQPKVYLALGNCLMGWIPDRESMALAWMHSGGARQMVGYVVSTWYGAAGWGVRDFWIGSQGRLTLAQAFFASTQAIIFELERRFQKTARVKIADYGIERNPKLLDKLAALYHITDRDNLGLLWDRDTFVFYGDPAWEARVDPVVPPDPGVSVRVAPAGAGRLRIQVEVVAMKTGPLSRPVFAWLPEAVQDPTFPKDVAAAAPGRFVIWHVPGTLKRGEHKTLRFNARRVSIR